MFTNLLVITILIIASWLGATIYYLYTSRQQETLKHDIQTLQTLLDKTEIDASH
ncbi:MAG: hypothetical protein WBP47_07805 [Candidatus Promineifilaceae bacterium]